MKELGQFFVGSAQPKDESEMEKFMKKASSKGVKVLCFPEGFLHCKGSVKKLSKLAEEYRICVVTGYDEFEEDGKKYQSALILNDNGEIVGKHRKTYLSNSEVEDGRTAGDKLEIFNTKYGKFGIVLCAEILCPEVSRVLTLKGAEIVFHLIGTGMDSQAQYDLWKSMIRTRAIENLLYFITSTHNQASRPEALGIPLGLIVNPGGQVLTEARKGGLVYAFLNLEKREEDARKGLFHSTYAKMISRRQPSLYSLIASH